jgi:hypothetical protein
LPPGTIGWGVGGYTEYSGFPASSLDFVLKLFCKRTSSAENNVDVCILNSHKSGSGGDWNRKTINGPLRCERKPIRRVGAKVTGSGWVRDLGTTWGSKSG